MAIDDYKVQHLFLLVGENPLPNYVAAKLLLTSEGERTLYLVHTSGTSGRAKDLKRVLIKDSLGLSDENIKLVSLEDESDAHLIKEKISQQLNNIKEKDIKIGLNYTGGTKAMSVHSYRALFYQKEKAQYTERPNIVFSYLDARHLEMRFDREDKKCVPYKVTPENLQVDLQTIFELHGWEFNKSKATYEPKLVGAAKALAQLYQESEEAAKLWRKWCDEVFKKDGGFKSEKELKKLDVLKMEVSESPSDEPKLVQAAKAFARLYKESEEIAKLWAETCDRVFQNINKEEEWEEVKKLDSCKTNISPKIQSVLEYLGTKEEEEEEEEAISLKAIKEKGKFQKIKHVWKWLDGEWLEHYVLQQVIDISEEMSIHECATSIDFFVNKKQFEFDVVFMRGYQLFAISCTTDETKTMNKSKLFEAYTRAQQLGGSEARVALVCCANSSNVKALKTEITNVFNPDAEDSEKDHRLKVFGCGDLMDLSALIKQWIKDVDKETE